MNIEPDLYYEEIKKAVRGYPKTNLDYKNLEERFNMFRDIWDLIPSESPLIRAAKDMGIDPDKITLPELEKMVEEKNAKR